MPPASAARERDGVGIGRVAVGERQRLAQAEARRRPPVSVARSPPPKVSSSSVVTTSAASVACSSNAPMSTSCRTTRARPRASTGSGSADVGVAVEVVRRRPAARRWSPALCAMPPVAMATVGTAPAVVGEHAGQHAGVRIGGDIGEHGLERRLVGAVDLGVGAPVTVAKFAGAEPMMLPPVNTRSDGEWCRRTDRRPAPAAALPATMELVSVVTAVGAVIVDPAAVVAGAVAGHGGVGQRDRGVEAAVNPAAVVAGAVAGDGRVGQRDVGARGRRKSRRRPPYRR